MKIRHRALTLLLFAFVFNIGCTTAQEKHENAKQDSIGKIVPTIYEQADQVKMNHWVDSVYNSLSMDERIGQLFSIIMLGNESKRKEIVNLVKNQHVGGIIFLKGTTALQASLTNDAQAIAKVPLMISIDGEWGLSMRLADTPRFPKNMMLGAIQNDSLLYFYGKEVARQCRLMGIHVNFAPDMDVNSNPANPVIGIRSYGEDPEMVSRLGIMYAKGLESGNVMSVAKHFPGHGNTSTDSHHTLPVVEETREELNKYELIPFKRYIDAKLSGMMVGHLNVPALDSVKQPSSLSKAITTDLLKDEMHFSGLTFTDGLTMKGVTESKDHCVRALLAGNDILLGPVNPVKQYNAVKKAVKDSVISEELINEKVKNVLAYKYILNVTNEKIRTDKLLDRINTPSADQLNRELHKKAITLLQNQDTIIPLKKLDKEKIAAVSIGSTMGNSFHKTLKKYGEVTTFNVADAGGLNALKTKLSKFTTVIISVHNTKVDASAAINNVTKDKKTILSFFVVPYRMEKYATAIENAEGVVLAYENTELAQDYAAQAIFGGNEIEGKIPVSVKDLFKVGEGINTTKTRLAHGIPEDVGIESNRLDSIEAIVKEGITAQAFPGCQILIAKDGVVIYDKAFGSFEYDGKEEVTSESIYDIASMTKAVATVPAVMKLYDNKKIKLTSTFSSFIPALKGTDKARITLRDGLLHESRITSFIPYYMDAVDKTSYESNLFNGKKTNVFTAQFDERTWARPDYKFKDSLVSKTPKEGFLQVADDMYVNKSYKDTIIANIASSKLLKRKRYMYSCLNFMLLKEVVESAAETDLSTYLQDNFYEKLGMNATAYNPLTRFDRRRIVPTEQDDFLRKQTLRGYAHDEGAAFMGGISGNAGLFSDANDMAKLCQLFLNKGKYGGERYLSEKTMNLFTQTKSGISRRGLGFDKPDGKTEKSSPTSPSTPLSTYGHTGFTGTSFWVDPDNNLIYIFLSNRVYPKRTHKELMTMNIRSRIQEEIYNAIAKKDKAVRLAGSEEDETIPLSEQEGIVEAVEGSIEMELTNIVTVHNEK